MNKVITCKKCGAEYSASQNLKFRVSGISSFFHLIENRLPGRKGNISNNKIDEADLNALTVCPKCGENNAFKGYKYFGLMGPTAMKIFLVLFLAAFIIYSIFIIFQ